MSATPRLFGVEPRLLLKGLALIASLAGLGFFIEASGLAHHLDTGWVDQQVRGHGAAGLFSFLAIASLFVAIGLPRQLVCFLAGYAAGLGQGFALASAASLIGCIACFYYGRLFGRDLVRHRYAARLERIDAFLAGHPVTMTVLIRFLPVGSNLLTNLLAGVSRVKALPFFAGSLLGYAPQTLVFCLLGSGIRVDPLWRTSLSVVLFLASAILGVALYRRLRAGRSLDASLDNSSQAP